MFDQPPGNLPVEDIFEKVEPAPKAGAGGGPAPLGAARPTAIRPVGAALPPVVESPGGGARRIVLFVVVSLAVIGVFAGSVFALRVIVNRRSAAPVSAENANLPAGQAASPAAEAVTNQPAAPAGSPTGAVTAEVTPPAAPAANAPSPVTTPPANVPPPTLTDTDGDGLDDATEVGIGTDARAADTDTDGLSDFEEVRTWKTDPLNPDTDGDGYQDGTEVKGGYDPKGPGKIVTGP